VGRIWLGLYEDNDMLNYSHELFIITDQ